MSAWFWMAVLAEVLYGAHRVFTRLASEHIGDGLGGLQLILQTTMKRAYAKAVQGKQAP